MVGAGGAPAGLDQRQIDRDGQHVGHRGGVAAGAQRRVAAVAGVGGEVPERHPRGQRPVQHVDHQFGLGGEPALGGHPGPRLEAVPELLQLVGERMERLPGALS